MVLSPRRLSGWGARRRPVGGTAFLSVILSEAKNPYSLSLCVTGKEWDEKYGFFGLTASE